MTTSVSPDARRVWRTARGPAAILLVIIIVGTVIALVRGGGDDDSLDPGSVAPSGSRALARLLEAEGVRIQPVRTAADASAALASGPATLLITRPDWVVPEGIAALRRTAAELILVSPRDDVLRALSLGVRLDEPTESADLAPDCGLEAARVAGVAAMGGLRFWGDAELCYGGSLARASGVTMLGTGAPLTNDRLGEQGNAALSMRLLGQRERLVWYVPSLRDPSSRPDQRGLVDLLPDGWRFGLVQVAIAVGVLAVWRARRLGPVVGEPLPVVVRAAETVEGRARLYRRAGAADHAAGALRQAVRDRLVPQLGLPRDAGPHAVAGTLAERTGRPAAELYDLLYGPPPTDDAALVRLADALDTMENEVTRR